MWPFRRARSRDSATQAAPPARREWASAASMPLMVQPMRSAFGTTGFEAELSSRQAPTFLEPLGHDLSPTAPAGLVSGLATSTTGRKVPPASPSTASAMVSRQTFDPPPWRA